MIKARIIPPGARLVFVGACLTAAVFGSAYGSQVIELNTAPVIATGPQILLRDLAREPGLLPNGWGDRMVLPSPNPGVQTEFSITSIAYALQKYPDMQEVTLRGQMQFRISRPGISLETDAVSSAIESYVQQSSDWSGQVIRVTCDSTGLDQSLPAGPYTINVMHHTAQEIPDTYRFALIINCADGISREAQAQATLTPMIPVWAARTAIAQGQLITDTILETRHFKPSEAADFIHASETIIGMEIGIPLRPNQPLRRSHIVQPLCSRIGDQVNVNAQRKGLSIMLRARALASGRRGDRVLCMNEQSKRRFLVRLTGTREASIDF